MRGVDMENYDVIIESDQKFNVTYKYEKKIVWAITYVNGRELKKYGDTQQTAYWALRQTVYQALNFRL